MNEVKIFLSVLALVIVIPGLVMAQEDTPVDQIRDAVTEKVKEKIEGVTSRKVGVVGQIDQIQESTLQVSNEVESFVVLTDDETSYSRIPGSSSLERDEIELNEYAIVMGSISSDGEGEVNAAIIQLIDEPTVPQREVLHGTMQEVSSSSLFLVLGNGDLWEVSFSLSTDIYDKYGEDGMEDITYRDLNEGDILIVAGEPDEDGRDLMDGLVVLRVKEVEEENVN